MSTKMRLAASKKDLKLIEAVGVFVIVISSITIGAKQMEALEKLLRRAISIHRYIDICARSRFHFSKYL